MPTAYVPLESPSLGLHLLDAIGLEGYEKSVGSLINMLQLTELLSRGAVNPEAWSSLDRPIKTLE